MALVQPPQHELSPPPSDISTDSAEQLDLLEEPENKRLHQSPPPRRQLYLILAKLGLFLIFAISYLIFCFIVHYCNVPIGRRGVHLGFSFLHFSTISAITTVAILVVYVALWPMKGVIDDIRAEEFFRLMDTHPNGMPLDSINTVSATTTGAFNIFMATIHRRCSLLLTSTLVITLAITATSSIAPAALSVGSIWTVVDNSTFLIGALPKDSFLVDIGRRGAYYNVQPIRAASTMAWIENLLNLTNNYYKVMSSEGEQFEYIVPTPPGYTSTMKAHWTTDVIVLDPSCTWQTATKITGNSQQWDVTLLQSNLSITLVTNSVELDTLNMPMNVTRVSVFVCQNRTTEFFIPMDGSMLFLMDSFPGNSSTYTTMPVDLSSVTTLKLPTGNIIAFLLCSPRVSIQTYQVSSTGNGNLTLGERQRSQGNIDFLQANYLLSQVLFDLPNSGLTNVSYQVGTDLMFRLIFGTQVPDIHHATPPAPLTNITAMYKQVIHSAMKPYLSGTYGTQNVPGGYIEEQTVFMSSLGHVVISAILFAFLTIALVAAQLRKGRAAFTLINVAAALADSDLPQKSVEMTQSKADTGERKVLKLVPGGDGRLYCVYERVD